MDGLKIEFPEHAGKYCLTHSMIECFTTCRRKCLYRYGFGLRERKEEEAEPLQIGTLVHKLLEEYHTADGVIPWPQNAPWTHSCAKASAIQSPNCEDTIFHQARAHAMMEVYKQLYTRVIGKSMQKELSFYGTIYNPDTGRTSRKVCFAGKIDQLVQDKEDQWWLMDHKTCQEVGDKEIKRAWLSPQLRRYAVYAKQCFDINPTGLIINYLGKGYAKRRIGETDAEFEQRKRQAAAEGRNPNRMRQKQSSTPADMGTSTFDALSKAPGRFFHQEQLVIPQNDRLRIQRELWSFAKEFLATLSSGRWLRSTSACFHYNRACEYFDMCSAGDTMNPNILQRYEVKRGHTELEEHDDDELQF